MDDPAGVVRVQPADRRRGDADERRHRLDLTADEDREMSVVVTGEDLTRSARHVRRGRWRWRGRLAAGRDHQSDEREGGRAPNSQALSPRRFIALSNRRAWGTTVIHLGSTVRSARSATITAR